MVPSIAIVLVVQLVAESSASVIKTTFAGHDRSEELMRALSVVDVNDRNMNTWWDQFSVSWAEYDLKVKQDPNLYCSAYKQLLSELGDLKSKVELVMTGLEAKEEQLRQIREILEHTEMGGKSGLHCKDDPEQAICKALDGLDKQAAEERVRLTAEMKTVTDEITKVENYNCDCTYNDWAAKWGACSTTCDVGIKEETRTIKWEKRNDGKDCDINDAKRTEKCNDGCCPKDCEWDKWGAWTACPEILTSEPQYEHAYRSILVEHECSERGGKACVGETQKSRKCNILDIKNEIIADKDKKIESLEEEMKGLKEGCKVKIDDGALPPSCVPCSAKACADAAEKLGLKLGMDDLMAFEDEIYSEKGCFSYNDGTFKGHAFYGTGGTEALKKKPLTGVKYRIKGCDCQE